MGQLGGAAPQQQATLEGMEEQLRTKLSDCKGSLPWGMATAPSEPIEACSSPIWRQTHTAEGDAPETQALAWWARTLSFQGEQPGKGPCGTQETTWAWAAVFGLCVKPDAAPGDN